MTIFKNYTLVSVKTNKILITRIYATFILFVINNSPLRAITGPSVIHDISENGSIPAFVWLVVTMANRSVTTVLFLNISCKF